MESRHPIAPDAPAAPAPDDAREARELPPQENADLCRGCVTCCTYLTIEIDAPRSAWEYDQWIWALHHRGIELYVERPERWFLLVHTPCDRLDAAGRCSIYGRHPVLCRDYDPRSCERRLPLAGIRAWFRDADEFEAWLAAERPRHFRRLMDHRRDFAPAPAAMVPVAVLVASASRPAAPARRRVRTPEIAGR